MNKTLSIALLFLSLNVFAAPVIKTQPTNIVAKLNSNATFKVSAIGSALSYSWFFQSDISQAKSVISAIHANPLDIAVLAAPISNSYVQIKGTSSNLTVQAVNTNFGNYYVVIADTTGKTTSSIVSLSVQPSPVLTNTTVTISWNTIPNLDHFVIMQSTDLINWTSYLSTTNTNNVQVFPKNTLGKTEKFYYVNAYHFAPTNSSVSLQWDKESDMAVTGYVIYFSTNVIDFNGRIDVGTNTLVTVSGLSSKYTYSFYVTAYNSSKLESFQKSNIANYTLASVLSMTNVPAKISVIQ